MPFPTSWLLSVTSMSEAGEGAAVEHEDALDPLQFQAGGEAVDDGLGGGGLDLEIGQAAVRVLVDEANAPWSNQASSWGRVMRDRTDSRLLSRAWTAARRNGHKGVAQVQHVLLGLGANLAQRGGTANDKYGGLTGAFPGQVVGEP